VSEKEIHQKELASVLKLYYQTGSSNQPRLFKVDEKEDQVLKSFYRLIKNEAKKRKIRPLELIRYFAENKDELIGFLEKKIIEHPKFKKIYTHSEIENILHKVFKTQKLNDKGMGIINEAFIAGEVKIWESKGVEYIVKAEDLLKFEGRPPKVYVSQIKNLSLLMGMIQEQQYNNDIKEAKCEFTFPYYVERRGYSKEEIVKGGKFYYELRRDLLTGAYTTYRIDKIIIDGKKYTRHGIPNFYILDEPGDPKDDWIVTFNNPYSDWVTKILNGEAGQYFTKNTKAIEDRKTTEKPYLFLFYMQLIKRKRANLLTTPVKIGNLLEDMKIDEQILARPKECYKLLKECLIYFSEHYQPVPEIDQFFLYNDFHKTKTVKLPLHISEAFEKYSYKDFKDLIKAIGIKDIREAFISFKRPHIKPKKLKLNKEEKEILERTLKWFNGQVTKIPLKDQESMVGMYIKKIGYDNYKRLFEVEANKLEANAVEFLTKTLPSK